MLFEEDLTRTSYALQASKSHPPLLCVREHMHIQAIIPLPHDHLKIDEEEKVIRKL